MRSAVAASLVALLLAGVAPPVTMADPTDPTPRQADMDDAVNATYALVRDTVPYVPAVALPVLHCPRATCYRSFGVTDAIAFAPLVERERDASTYEGGGWSDGWWSGSFAAGDGAVRGEDSVGDSSYSGAAPDGSWAEYEAAYRTLILFTDALAANVESSESRSSRVNGSNESSSATHGASGAANTIGLPANGLASAAASHSRSAFHNDTMEAETSDTFLVIGFALDDPNGDRSSETIVVGASSDHLAESTVVLVHVSNTPLGAYGQSVELPFVLP